ncbi:hypothetical protein AVEN_23060-1 [Araneus ventricosus]|uniref:Gustatory receptor n=1 Tax=Araneus ventricosus TaxID=182803 RepID=A0A4Y2IP94_ARAVE|nr:hypothetical protein AVEN_23060-1 [Araneus ventricosus]
MERRYENFVSQRRILVMADTSSFTLISESRRHRNGTSKFLSILIRLAGLTEDSKKSVRTQILSISFGSLITFGTLDVWIYIVLQVKNVILNLTVLSALACSMITWHWMNRNRKQLSVLLKKFRGIYSSSSENRINIIVIFILCLPLLYSVLFTIFCNRPKEASFHGYGIKMSDPTFQIIFIFTKQWISYFIFPTFTNVVTLLYCDMCLKCSAQLNRIIQQINHFSTEAFGPSEQINILRCVSKIDDILESVQEVFSVPSLFLIAANFLSCMYALGMFLDVVPYSEYILFITDFLLYGGISFTAWTFILWAAGGLPVKMDELKKSFHKKAQLRLIFRSTLSEQQIIREMFVKRQFSFTACDLFSYRRSTILALLGTLLTYAFLVFSSHH